MKIEQGSPAEIKPETGGRGWWIVSTDYQKRDILSYIQAGASLTETVMQVPYKVKVLGDWPELTCLVYVDDAHQLHYTLDPQTGWQKVSFQDVLGACAKSINCISPVSMHNISGNIFLSAAVDDLSHSLLLLRLQAASADVVSAFYSSTHVMRWGDWLVLYNDAFDAILSKKDYVELMEADVLPPNKGVLFYHPITGHFLAKPHAAYSAMQTLRESLKAASNPLKHPL